MLTVKRIILNECINIIYFHYCLVTIGLNLVLSKIQRIHLELYAHQRKDYKSRWTKEELYLKLFFIHLVCNALRKHMLNTQFLIIPHSSIRKKGRGLEGIREPE